MRSDIALCLFAMTGLAAAGFYTNRYDNVNLEEILANRRLLLPYLKCFVDEGKCTPEGNEAKIHIAEALQDDCAKCTKQQKKGSKRVMSHIYKNEQEYWAKLKSKYDPEDIYEKKYGAELRGEM